MAFHIGHMNTTGRGQGKLRELIGWIGNFSGRRIVVVT